MGNLADTVSELIKSPLFVFVISVLNCAFTFLFVLSIIRSFRSHYKALVVLFVIADASAAALVHVYANQFFDIVIIPILVVTAIIVFQLMIVTKDEPEVYYLMFKLILMNYLGIFCAVSFIMRIFVRHTGYVSVYLCITVIVSFLVNLGLYVGKKFFRDVTYAYIHNKENSSLLSVYLTSGNLMLILSLILIGPVLSNTLESSMSEKVLYMDGAIMTMFLLSLVYIIFMIYRSRDEYQNNKQLENELYKAKCTG